MGKDKKRHDPYDVENEEEDEVVETAKNVGKFLLKTFLISGAVIGGTALALPLIGFGALGPVAGSLAASYQSAVLGGTIASGSVFATLQSVGMVGLSAAAKAGIVGGSAAVAAATTGSKKKKEKKR